MSKWQNFDGIVWYTVNRRKNENILKYELSV